MEEDDPMSNGHQAIADLASGPLPDSLSSLSSSFRGIPSGKDFYFFNNFEEFKLPLQKVSSKSQSLLEKIGASSGTLCKQELSFPTGRGVLETDEAYDWLVNVNDEIFERVDASLEQFERSRSEGVDAVSMEDGGFQMVYGKKKKTKVIAGASAGGVSDDVRNGVGSAVSGVKVAEHLKETAPNLGKGKVPFHVASIQRPQEAYSILVNNASEPFQHVWLETSEDGTRFVHPLEKLSVSDFVDWTDTREPLIAHPLEKTPFNYIEDVKDLKKLAIRLREAKEFAVDLEHNHYRSFQGLTCLIQISTRDEDYIVDALKLKILVGPHLREVFKDASKRKVMHGAERDILWLQRDFGIYICNLFDTRQASKILNLERNSLEFLLQHFCGVAANKEYQTADWRLRPLPTEMIKYAREDTHYLLQIYDMMRNLLLAMPSSNESNEPPLLEVYNRSAEICTQFYEKELITENSYLYVYGLQDAGFNAEQLSVAAGLFAWRDAIARAEDESTGYILPNKTLLEIAKQMPPTVGKLRRILKSKHPYVERSLNSIVDIVKQSVKTAGRFEGVAQSLKESRFEKKKSVEAAPSCSSASDFGRDSGDGSNYPLDHFSEKTAKATVPALKNPVGALGALLGSSAAKKAVKNEKEEHATLQKIRSSFPSVFGKNNLPESLSQEPMKSEKSTLQTVDVDAGEAATKGGSVCEDVILLENTSDAENSEQEGQDGRSSLADLSQSFEKCLQNDKSVEFQPFDYEAAPKFWESSGEGVESQRGAEGRQKNDADCLDDKAESGGRAFPAPRRRQAFPVTGNRSATFR